MMRGFLLGGIMRLYYFTNEQYGLEAIRDQRIKISIIKDLNDPFEFTALSLTGLDQRETLNHIKSGVSENVGIVCLSSSWQHILMWSHYADKHRGICLGFDFQGHVEKVQYDSKFLTAEDLGVTSNEDITNVELAELIRHKSSVWRYEKEYRLLCPNYEPSAKDPISQIYFLNFSDRFKLKQVILGCNSNLSSLRLKQVLASKSKSIRCFRARPSDVGFKVTKEPIF
ncbi:DUF2971 domain-containing protein [Asticcacaulis sp. ZE23SCel15]|uniref:DUF2971 domain-containing protein n=1 Tax=Asticcacaulis sp. ZE23SCel15 TaxID=3059027 RepID=UPI00265D8BE3|nr:DUF2971 domain-containing protein [Asticcacaulis sp. ZE23SCel15]WKL58041.1 DUF2971 domain-containing protein [Asticcacaulis sp. ZE23SCel15]